MTNLTLVPAPELTLTSWRPPGWHDGIDDLHAPDEGHVPENIETQFAAYDKAGYYTRGGKLTEKGLHAVDSKTASDVSTNRKLLRDAWNTHPRVWLLASRMLGVDFKVDPFHNPAAQALPRLVRKLGGHTPETDGLAHVDGFPLNWRGKLKQGKAAAAVNGPHSMTERWLSLCAAYGEEEFVAAFVPDCGDAWFQQIGMRAQIVIRLGRVSCLPPPGIKSSAPRGASALLLWIPAARVEDVPAHTKLVLSGVPYRVPLWTRRRKGTQYAFVQPANTQYEAAAEQQEVDLGLLATAADE